MIGSVENHRILWVPITIRIAWEFYMQGLSFGSEILGMAQLHVLSSLPADVDQIHAERLAIVYTKEFIERLNGEAYVPPQIHSDVYMDIPLSWRNLLERRASTIGKQIFHLHYRDAFSLEEVGTHLNISVPKIKKVRRQLHQFVYRVLLRFDMEDPDVLDQIEEEWPLSRIEKIIRYLALIPSTTQIDCDILLSPEGAALQDCPRLFHAYTLLKEGVLSPKDLSIPEKIPSIQHNMSVLALQLNPEGRKYTKIVKKSLQDIALFIRGGVWLIAAEDIVEAEEILHELAEDGTPSRQMLRGAIGHGTGIWSDDGIFGPLPTKAITLVRNRPWGKIDGMAQLPEPLPPPKKPIKAWVFAFASIAMSLMFFQESLSTDNDHSFYPIQAASEARVQDVAIRFDIDDMAVLHILAYQQGSFAVLHENLIHEKGFLATKDGRYFIRANVDRLIVVSTPYKIENWDSLLEGVSLDEDPLYALQSRILKKEPRACVVPSKGRRQSENTTLANLIEDWTY